MAGSLSGADLKNLSYMGIRLGVGHFSTDSPDNEYINYNITADRNGFFSELFYNWQFMNELALDLSLGVINRGEFRWVVEEGNFFGSINVYPISIGIKARPFANMLSKHYQPYVAVGGSLCFGRAVIEGGTVYDYRYYIDSPEKTRTDVGWWISTGFESFVSSTIMITSTFKYQGIKFSNTIGGYKDYTGYQIAFGVGYVFKPSK